MGLCIDADSVEQQQHRAIGTHQKMLAVVQAQMRFAHLDEQGPGSTTRLRGGIEQEHAMSGFHQSDAGGQPRPTRADHGGVECVFQIRTQSRCRA